MMRVVVASRKRGVVELRPGCQDVKGLGQRVHPARRRMMFVRCLLRDTQTRHLAIYVVGVYVGYESFPFLRMDGLCML